MPTLRERNRRSAMRLTQRTALDLFEAHGFDAVTVSQIADEVGMAASTIYRHFATKEAIVLWDEHDDPLESALIRELSSKPPLAALRAAFVHELGGRYDDDLEFQLRRWRYIYATEQLHSAAVETQYADADSLAEGLEQFLSAGDRAAAPILAASAMVALDVAFDRWQADGGATPLGTLIDEAFEALAKLDQLR